MKLNFQFTFLLILFIWISCTDGDVDSIAPNPIVNDTVKLTCTPAHPNPEDLVNGDPLPIVEGKILSWAVSTDDEIAYTPPGKWVNVFGTVYYRYVERAEGANIKVNEVAASASNILTTEQLDMILEIVEVQAKGETQAITNRNLIARELIKWRDGDNADEQFILQLAQENGELLGRLIKQKAAVYGAIIKELSITQKNDMCELRKSSDHANSSTDILSSFDDSMSSEERNILRLLLSKFFIWTTSLEEMNKVVDTGRPAVYFGFANLRIEDRSGENVSAGLRGEVSKLVGNLISADQKTVLDQLITDQTNSLDTYYSSRAELAHEIMSYQVADAIADVDVISNLAILSELAEAELAIIQAKGMATIIRSFSQEQMQTLIDFKSGNGE